MPEERASGAGGSRSPFIEREAGDEERDESAAIVRFGRVDARRLVGVARRKV